MNKHTRVWSLQEAKAKFSEVVRRAQTEGPQTVTVHGKVAVTISSPPEAPEAGKKLTGADLVKALQANPGPDFDLPEREKDSTFRDIDL
ncbi:MAG: type II toxin-antitoxin system prevent-host-death family antitoxin [Aestuariivirga sp.]